MTPMKRVIHSETNDNKENFTINKEILKSNDLPSVKMVRQSLTTIFRENKRKAMMLALPSICVGTESLIAGTNGEKIDASTVSYDSIAINKNVPAIVSSSKSSTIVGQKTTVNSSNSESAYFKAYQSKTVIQKNATKGSGAAGPSNSSHFKNPMTKSTDTFQCKICDKKFLLKTTLVAHQKTHIDVNSNCCQHCKRAFEKPIALSKHLRENCTKISVAAKKRLLAEDMQLAELNQTKQKSSDLQLKNSKTRNLPSGTQITGICRTSKKVITCHQCGDTFLDVMSYACHAEWHATTKPM